MEDLWDLLKLRQPQLDLVCTRRAARRRPASYAGQRNRRDP